MVSVGTAGLAVRDLDIEWALAEQSEEAEEATHWTGSSPSTANVVSASIGVEGTDSGQG